MGEVDVGELVLDEGVGFADGGGRFGDEDCSFVGVVAEDYGDFDEFALLEKPVCVVWDEGAVDDGTVQVERCLLGGG